MSARSINSRAITGIPTGTGASDAIDVERLRSVTVSISGTFSATYDVEGSFDGATFAPINGRTGETNPRVFTLQNFALKAVRINVTAYTSGTLVGAVADVNG